MYGQVDPQAAQQGMYASWAGQMGMAAPPQGGYPQQGGGGMQVQGGGMQGRGGGGGGYGGGGGGGPPSSGMAVRSDSADPCATHIIYTRARMQ